MFDSGKIKSLFAFPEKFSSTYIISEIGINHNGSLQTAIDLIHAAKDAGVDAVKFQKRDIQSIYSSRVLNDANSAEWSFEYLIPLLKEVELSTEDFQEIRHECDRLELDLIITPFDQVSAKFVAELGVSAFKISSADMTNIPLLQYCKSFLLPMIISVGMWDDNDIQNCIEIYKSESLNFALLLAQSTYPASYETLSLGYINRLKEYSRVVGYSGHERGTFIPIAARALGCKIIEKHITFDKNAKGPDHKASMLPDEWNEMVSQLRLLEKTLGSEKRINQAETLSKEAFAKSAVALKDIPANHVLSYTDITYKSPGKGIFPHEIHNYIGRIFTKSVARDHYINKTDFEETIAISEWKNFSFNKMWGVKCRFHDYDSYKILQSPCIEFHCSQTDLDVDFCPETSASQLIVHAPEIFDRRLVDICSEDPEHVGKSLKILQHSIDKTLSLAKYFPRYKPLLVVHLGGMFLDKKELDDTNVLNDRALENFRKLQYVSDDIDILPENLPPRPWYLGGEWFQHGFMLAEDMINFCTALEIGMAFDICHASLYCNHFNLDLNAYTKKIMPHVHHVHVSDAKGIHGEGIQVGEGEIDFDSLFEEMQDFEFSWVPEVWSGHLHQGAGIYNCLKKLEKYNGSL